MAATDALRHYVKRHSTVQGADALYLDDEFDKISQSIKILNDTLKTVSLATIPLTQIAGIVTGTFLGNISGSTQSPVALTATQVTAALNVATTLLNGLVPAPGSVAGKFLGDDLTWHTVSLSGLLVASNNLSDLTNTTTARSNLGISTVGHTGAYADVTGTPTLGTAAALNVGTAVNNVVQMATGPKLPAVDGSALTNLNAQPILTTSTLPVGACALCLYNAGVSTVANGATTAGTTVFLFTWDNSGPNPAQGAVQTGTWKNISGNTLHSGDAGLFVRTV